jgi:hypothetical protein
MSMYLEITSITTVNAQDIILSVTWWPAPVGGSAYAIEQLTFPLAEQTSTDDILSALSQRATQMQAMSDTQSAVNAGLASYVSTRTKMTS